MHAQCCAGSFKEAGACKVEGGQLMRHSARSRCELDILSVEKGEKGRILLNTLQQQDKDNRQGSV